jgi:hypothetical protein
VPISAAHGPRILSGGRAASYTHDAEGAALAAVQVLVRTSPTAGAEIAQPVLAEQVVGPNAGALAGSLASAPPGAGPGLVVPRNDAKMVGYRITSYRQGGTTAVVEVVLSSPGMPTGQVVDFTVSLQWLDDDWRVLAPPDGDWGSVATTLAAAPVGTRDYGQVG